MSIHGEANEVRTLIKVAQSLDRGQYQFIEIDDRTFYQLSSIKCERMIDREVELIYNVYINNRKLDKQETFKAAVSLTLKL